MLFPAKKIVQAIAELGYGKDLNLGLNRWLAGMTGQTGSTNDLWFAYLRGLGYTGSLNSMVKAYYAASKGAAITNPIPTLFRNNEKGFHFDPSDFTTLFQDNAGTTPVSAVGQTVGLMLDKSQGLVLGAELIDSGAWTAASGWSESSGTITVSGTQAQNSTIAQNDLVVGKSYQITFTVSGYVQGQLSVTAGTSLAHGGKITANGTYSRKIIAAASTAFNFQDRELTKLICSISNISVRELPGYHATQATSTARPIIGRHPITGRRNLLTYTEDFSNAAWTNVNSTDTSDVTVAPNGSLTADSLTDDATAAKHTVYTAAVIPSGTNVVSCYMKAGTNNFATLIVNSIGNGRGAIFNLATGTVDTDNYLDGTGGTVTSARGSIVSAGNGWYRCSVTVVTTGTNSLVIGSAVSGSALYAGTGKTIYIWGAQAEIGATLTAYQKVVSTYDVTEAGVNDAYYLKFDGVDDFLVTPSIDFSGTDKMSVFAGVRKLSDAAVGCICELSVNVITYPGSFILACPGSILTKSVLRVVGNVANVEEVGVTAKAPITHILSGLANIPTDSVILRLNGGSEISTGANDLGTGNFGNYPIYIGMRAGTSLPFNGHLYSLIVRGALSDSSQISAGEVYCNSKTGAY